MRIKAHSPFYKKRRVARLDGRASTRLTKQVHPFESPYDLRFRDYMVAIEAGNLKPLLARRYPLENIKQAQSDFKDKQFFGKLVIVP